MINRKSFRKGFKSESRKKANRNASLLLTNQQMTKRKKGRKLMSERKKG